jgi:hypothetical protein
MRSRERRSGHQTGLWEDLDYSVHFYVTNDHAHTADDLARRYDGRAGIKSIIAELKGGLAIGKVSTEAFDANETAFLLKLLAFNLLRRWVQQQPIAIRHWRVSWIRRVCVHIPARLLARAADGDSDWPHDPCSRERHARLWPLGERGSRISRSTFNRSRCPTPPPRAAATRANPPSFRLERNRG